MVNAEHLRLVPATCESNHGKAAAQLLLVGDEGSHTTNLLDPFATMEYRCLFGECTRTTRGSRGEAILKVKPRHLLKGPNKDPYAVSYCIVLGFWLSKTF